MTDTEKVLPAQELEEESPDGTPADEVHGGEAAVEDLRLSVRKLVRPVRPRGVLAE
jgi:hypothetical protein